MTDAKREAIRLIEHYRKTEAAKIGGQVGRLRNLNATCERMARAVAAAKTQSNTRRK